MAKQQKPKRSLEEDFWTLRQFLSLLIHEKSKKDFSGLVKIIPLNIVTFIDEGEKTVKEKDSEKLSNLNEQLKKIALPVAIAVSEKKISKLEKETAELIISGCSQVGWRIEAGAY